MSCPGFACSTSRQKSFETGPRQELKWSKHTYGPMFGYSPCQSKGIFSINSTFLDASVEGNQPPCLTKTRKHVMDFYISQSSRKKTITHFYNFMGVRSPEVDHRRTPCYYNPVWISKLNYIKRHWYPKRAPYHVFPKPFPFPYIQAWWDLTGVPFTDVTTSSAFPPLVLT